MSLKKDSQKSKAIWLAIDIVLLVVALCVLGYCGQLAYSLYQLRDVEMLEQNIVNQQEQIAQLNTRIDEQTRVVEHAEAESLAAFGAASDALALVQGEYDTVYQEHTGLKTQVDDFNNAVAAQEQLKLDIADIRTLYGQTIRQLEDKILAGESEYKICYLTFDDGPSYMTSYFLDKIDTLDIYVTFFTIGKQLPEQSYPLRDEMLRREALGGHSLANHTYTHAIFGSLYKSLDNFVDAVKKQDELVYEITGMHTDIVRFPAGSYYCPFRTDALAALDEMGFGWIDWIANAYDSGTTVHPSDKVVNNVIYQVRQDDVTVVLMHDWRSETLSALERIVTALKKDNYLFLPLFKESSTVGTATPKWG